jgi:hypothetical protein
MTDFNNKWTKSLKSPKGNNLGYCTLIYSRKGFKEIKISNN